MHQYVLQAGILKTSLTQSSKIRNHQAGQVPKHHPVEKSVETPASFSPKLCSWNKTEQAAVMVGHSEIAQQASKHPSKQNLFFET